MDATATKTVTKEQFEFLRSLDTPTVCNLLEMVAPERRGLGYSSPPPSRTRWIS